MYAPEHFKESSKQRLEALIEQNSFATLVTTDNGTSLASHLPLLFDPSKSKNGILIGHMARANQQWKSFKDAQTVLVIFQGAHAYVSPSWYKSSGFPTWNYAAVHVYGKPKIVHDESALYSIIERLTEKYESQYQQPWVPDISDKNKSNLLRVIVGFEIEITDIQGKFKLSQNRSAEDQQSVIKHLDRQENTSENSVTDLMKENLENTF